MEAIPYRSIATLVAYASILLPMLLSRIRRTRNLQKWEDGCSYVKSGVLKNKGLTTSEYQCLRCTEAFHWKCLSPTEQREVLQATRLRESEVREADNAMGIDSEDAPSERQSINAKETATFVCASCNIGGVCFECHRDLEPMQGITQVDSSSATAPKVSEPQTAAELLFRCISCQRAAHYAHLRSPWTDEHADQPGLIEEMATHYQNVYKWQCDDCSSYDASVDKIIAWRPYPPNAPVLSPEEVYSKRIKDHWPREYLIKWESKSYRRTSWVPHLWLVSTTYQKLRHFILNGSRVRLEHLRAGGIEGHDEDARRRVYEEEGGPPLPNPRADECIPEPWKRIEQVLDILLWAPHKRINAVKTKATNKRGKVVHSSGSDEEADEELGEEELRKLEVLRESTRNLGRLCLGPEATETPLARKRRKGGEALNMEDIDDVVWCYVKWGELEYQEGKLFCTMQRKRRSDTLQHHGTPHHDEVTQNGTTLRQHSNDTYNRKPSSSQK